MKQPCNIQNFVAYRDLNTSALWQLTHMHPYAECKAWSNMGGGGSGSESPTALELGLVPSKCASKECKYTMHPGKGTQA